MLKSLGDKISAIAAVLDQDKHPVGTAFLLSPHLLISCAHVIERAVLGTSPEGVFSLPGSKETPLNVTIGTKVNLHFAAAGKTIEASLETYYPLTHENVTLRDIAVLSIKETLDSSPLILNLNENYWNQHIRTFGFPAARPYGSHAEADLKEVVANGWVLLRGGMDAREFVRPGFSGAPVFNDEGLVVGMLSAGTQVQREALMIPAKRFLQAHPALAEDLPFPYPGLKPFQQKDQRFFFGRNKDLEAVTQLLTQNHKLILTGSSGSGKSSFIQASLMPYYQTKNWLCLYISTNENLTVTLSQAVVSSWLKPGPSQLLETKQLAASLETGNLKLKEVLLRLLNDTEYSGILIVLDQLEEWYKPIHSNLLQELIASSQKEVHILTSVRADFLENFLSTLLLQLPLFYLATIPDLKELIEAPLSELGVGQLESGLTKRLLDDLKDEVNPLPLLQFCLHELWLKREGYVLSHTTYDKLGGIQKAISQYAETCFQMFSSSEQINLKSIFIQLIQPNQEKPTKRISNRASFDKDKQKLIDTLANQRLINLSENGKLELSHEALISSWPRLYEWYESSREFREFQEKLRLNLSNYKQHKHPDFLLKGLQLAEAEQYLNQELADDELSFIRESQDFIESLRQEEINAGKRKLSLQRRLSQTLALLFIISLVGMSFGFYLYQQANHQTNLAQTAQNFAEEQARQAMVAQLSAQALLANQQSQVLNGVTLAFAAHETNIKDAGSNLQIAKHSKQTFKLPAEVLSTQLSQDVIQLISKDAKLIKINLSTGEQLLEKQLELGFQASTSRAYGASLLSATFTKEGKLLLGMSDGSLWQMSETGEKQTEIWLQDEGIKNLKMNPDGKSFLTSGLGDSSSIRIWNYPDMHLQKELKRPHYRALNALSFNTDGTHLVTGSIDTSLSIWNTSSFKRLASLTPYKLELGFTYPDIQGIPSEPFNRQGWVTAVAISPDNKLLARGGYDGSVTLIDLESQKKSKLSLPKQPHTVSALAFSPDSQSLAIGSQSGAIRQYQLNGSETTYYQGSERAIQYLVFSDENHILSLTKDSLTSWEITQVIKPSLIFSGTREARFLALSPDAETLAIASSDRSIYLYDVTTKEQKAKLSELDLVWANLAFSPNGKTLAASAGCCTFAIWNLETNKPQSKTLSTPTGIETLNFQDNETLLLSRKEGTDTFNLTTQSLTLNENPYLEKDKQRYTPIAEGVSNQKNQFIPSSPVLLFLYNPLTDLYINHDWEQLYFWNANTQEKTKELKGHTEIITTLALSSDNKLLASSGSDRKIILWDAQTGEQLSEPLLAHTDGISSLIFHPTKPLLYSGSQDGRVIMWELPEQIVSR